MMMRFPGWILRLRFAPRRMTGVGGAHSARVFPVQRIRVETQVVLDEAGDEEVAVVIAGMAAQRERLPGLATRRLEAVDMQLLVEELVRQALVDEQRGRAGPSLHEPGC